MKTGSAVATMFVLSILLAWVAVGLYGIVESIIHCRAESIAGVLNVGTLSSADVQLCNPTC